MRRWIEGIRNMRPLRPLRPMGSEEGAVLLTVALTSLVIFGLVAIGVDGSRMYNERRHAQNAADEAAIAGAWARCQGGGVAPAALSSAAINGFDNDGTTNTVSVTHPYDGDPNVVHVAISSIQDASFAAVIGFDQLTVAASAAARCEGDGGGIGVAIFATGETCGGNNLDSQASTILVDGGLHSNDGLHMNAPGGATVIGPATYRGSSTGNGIPAHSAQTGFRESPGTWSIADYAPGGSRALAAQSAGEYHFFSGDVNNADLGVSMGMGGELDPGLYFVDGAVDLQKVEGNVTIVSTGRQTYRGELNLANYEPDLVMFTTAPGSPSCGYEAIRFDAAGGFWRGIIYAPNGQVSMSLATAATQHGSIVAYTVDISGSSFSLEYVPAFDTQRGPFVQIEH